MSHAPAAAAPRIARLQVLADRLADQFAIAPVLVEADLADAVRAQVSFISDAVAYYVAHDRRVVISYNEIRRPNSALAYADALQILAHEVAHAVDFDRRPAADSRHDAVFDQLYREVILAVEQHRSPADRFADFSKAV